MRIARLRPTGLRTFWGALDASQRRTLVMMVVVVGALHVIGFVTLFALVAPSHYHLGASGSFTIGIGITAYTLGMRHAFDADHISAIDNTLHDRVRARIPDLDRRPLTRRRREERELQPAPSAAGSARPSPAPSSTSSPGSTSSSSSGSSRCSAR
jgi:hypothetical protein